MTNLLQALTSVPHATNLVYLILSSRTQERSQQLTSAAPWPCRDLGGEQARLSGLEHMALGNGGHDEVQS